MPEGGPIIPFTPAQWKRFEQAKADGTEWFGWVYRDGRWIEAPKKGESDA